MNMKISLFFSMITQVLAFNRLQSFRHYHRARATRQQNYVDRHKHIPTINEGKQQIISGTRHTKNLAITRKEPAETIRKKICTNVTCTKCEKALSYGVKQEYCTVILNLSNCCINKRILNTAF